MKIYSLISIVLLSFAMPSIASDHSSVVTVHKKVITKNTFSVDIPVAGRYRVDLHLKGEGVVNIEDYIFNKDGRTYDITGDLQVNSPKKSTIISRDGSPLDQGTHDMKINVHRGSVVIDWITFTLLKKHKITPTTLLQNHSGDTWNLVWSDEFDTDGAPNPAIWTYEVGNWGWGNREPQYYTENRRENARCENGNLVIEARKDRKGGGWSSARLTTAGRISFQYGRIEFSAKTTGGDGCWPAVWLLGDDYRDEISWPYCGEVDILEAVGYKIDEASGAGETGFACHTRAYYFKQNNHISSHIKADDLITRFHTYALEWTPKAMMIYFDDKLVYTYDHHSNDREFPFNKPQNLIVNMAMGGNNGKEIDPILTSQRIELEYIRVYGRK
jgi:beta-glucanase (GH16 family)